jgi:hypothetical protein
LSAKDNRILELSEQVAELGRKVFDLEENLREKDEVIAARSASIRPPVFTVQIKKIINVQYIYCGSETI